MSDNAVFQATFVDVRTIKTRKVVQFIFEVAQEQANQALECLGGLPRSDIDTWVAVARIQMPGKAPEPRKGFYQQLTPEQQRAALEYRGNESHGDQQFKTRTPWHELKPSQQAGIRCNDPEFWKWLPTVSEEFIIYDENTAAEFVREYCDVESRSHLNTNLFAKGRWIELDNRFQTEAGKIAEER